MKYYKDINNQVYAFEVDGSQDDFIKPNLVLMTEQEVDEFLNAPETPEHTITRLEFALDRHIDAVANSYRYESIRTMVSYVGDPNPKFNAEGTGAFNWRSACYTLGIEIMEEVMNGQREIPTEQELIDLMPSIEQYIEYPA